MKNKKLKIAMVGLGATGSVIARLCQKDKDVEKLTCFVRDADKAKEFLPDGTRKIILRQMDAVKERAKFVKEIIGADIVINAASSKINLEVMDAAYTAGMNYLDLASEHLLSPFKAEQFEFDRKFRNRDLRGLICAGAAPGISNLLIIKLADDFDSIETVKLRLAEYVISQDFVSSWSPDLAIEELTLETPIFKDGCFMLKKPFSEEEVYDYPPPFGKMPATLICQDEQLTIPLFIKVRNMDVKSGGGDIEPMKLLYHLGLLSKKPVKAGKVSVRPLELLKKIIPPTPSPSEMLSIVRKKRIQEARFGIVAELVGKKNGRALIERICLSCPSIFDITRKMPGATYISYPTGLLAYLMAKSLPNADYAGIIPPEGLANPIRSKILDDFVRISGSKLHKERL